MKLHFKAFCLTLIVAGSLVHYPIQAQQTNRKFKETQLARIDDADTSISGFTFSKNMRRIAYIVHTGNKYTAVIDGIRGKDYDDVSTPVFSTDGKSYVYAARKRSKWILVNGDKQEIFVDSSAAIVSAMIGTDNKTILCVLLKDKKYSLAINGVKGKWYDLISGISFSNDGNKLAYVAQSEKRQMVVFDGQEGPAFEQVGYPVLSKDGKRIAYWALKDKKYHAVVDNQINKPFEEISSFLFSDDGKHYSYIAKTDKKAVVVLDTLVSDKYELAYSLCFNPDGNKLAYGIETAHGNKEGFKQYVIKDGKIIGPYENVVEGSLKFNSDGSAFAYKVEIRDAFYMMCKGEEGKHYSDVLQTTMTFSPDNLRFAYAAENDGKRFIIVNGVEGKPYQDIFSVFFSPDSKRLVYSAKQDNKELIVVDDTNGGMYDSILGSGEVIFDSPNSFHYIAKKGNTIVLVEEQIN